MLGSVLLLGSAQSLKFSLQSAQVSRSILTENDLKASISQGLKEGCATHLRPSQLTNTDTAKKNKGIGTVTNGLPGVKVGDFNGDIEVVKIELTGDPADEDRFLVVYYKKKGLGEDLNTLGGAACSPKDGTTPAVTTGCYYHRCSIDYSGIFDDYSTSPPTPVSPPENQKCKLKTCHNIAQEVLAEMEGKVVDLVKCSNPGDHFTGFDENGVALCRPPVDCGEGNVVQGIDSNGNIICKPGCSGGRQMFEKIVQVYRPSDPSDGRVVSRTYRISNLYTPDPSVPTLLKVRFCKCPPDKPHWNHTECVASCRDIYGGRRWIQAELKCMYCVDSWEGRGWQEVYDPVYQTIGYECNCGQKHRYKYKNSNISGYFCNNCPHGTKQVLNSSYFSNNIPEHLTNRRYSCQSTCPPGEDLIRTGDNAPTVCLSSCSTGEERVGTQCLSSCSTGEERVGTQCRLRCADPHSLRDSRGNCVCWHGYYKVNGKCCPEGYHYITGDSYCKRDDYVL